MDSLETTVVCPRDNGPIVIRGSVVLEDAEGNCWDIEGKPAISLCRCGGSLNKPFCDGAHKENGFTAEDRAG